MIVLYFALSIIFLLTGIILCIVIGKIELSIIIPAVFLFVLFILLAIMRIAKKRKESGKDEFSDEYLSGYNAGLKVAKEFKKEGIINEEEYKMLIEYIKVSLSLVKYKRRLQNETLGEAERKQIEQKIIDLNKILETQFKFIGKYLKDFNKRLKIELDKVSN